MTVISRFRNLVLATCLMATSGVFASVTFFSLDAPDTAIAEPSLPQGGVLLIQVADNTRVWFNEQAVFIDESGYGLIASHRDDTQAVLRWQRTGAEPETLQIPVIARNYAIERIDGLPAAKVTAPLDPEIQQRIRSEALAVRMARTQKDSRRDFIKGFIWPVEGRLSGHYGSQRILNGKPRTPHYGVDVAAPTGTPVVAPAGGKIIYANSDMYYSGGTLVIDHGHGLSSTFLHLSELMVSLGEDVKQGQVVARVGATGRATGPHLDWRMNWGPSTRIDPELLVPPMNKE